MASRDASPEIVEGIKLNLFLFYFVEVVTVVKFINISIPNLASL